MLNKCVFSVPPAIATQNIAQINTPTAKYLVYLLQRTLPLLMTKKAAINRMPKIVLSGTLPNK